MAIFFNDGLDDPLIHDVCDSFSGGQVSDTRSNRLERNQAVYLLNCDIQKDGQIETRRGTMALGGQIQPSKVQGLVWFDTAAFEYLVAFVNTLGSDTLMYRYTGGAWSQWSMDYAGVAENLINTATLIDSLYIVDGVNNVQQWDGTTLTDLGGGGANQPPAAASIIIAMTNRLFVSGVLADPTSIHISTIGAPLTWDTSTMVINVGQGENDPITNLTSWDKFNLVVFKKNSTWLVDVSPAADVSEFPIQLLHRSVGCVGSRAACMVGQDVWFLSYSGVHSVRRNLVGDNNEVTVPISQPIQDVIERINWTHAYKSVALFYNNRFFLSVPLDGSIEPNSILVYDTLNKAWSGSWTGINATSISTSGENNELRLNFGRSDGRVVRWLNLEADTLDGCYRDLTEPIPTAITTRAMVFGEALNPKQVFNLGAEFYRSYAPNAKIQFSVDQADPVDVQASFDTASAQTLLPQILQFFLLGPKVKRRAWSIQGNPNFYEMQVLVTSPADKIGLRMLTASAFIETIEVEIA